MYCAFSRDEFMQGIGKVACHAQIEFQLDIAGYSRVRDVSHPTDICVHGIQINGPCLQINVVRVDKLRLDETAPVGDAVTSQANRFGVFHGERYSRVTC